MLNYSFNLITIQDLTPIILNSPLRVEAKRTCPPMLCGGNPVFGAAGRGILAFRLLDPVPVSAGREFPKIVARFYCSLGASEFSLDCSDSPVFSFFSMASAFSVACISNSALPNIAPFSETISTCPLLNPL